MYDTYSTVLPCPHFRLLLLTNITNLQGPRYANWGSRVGAHFLRAAMGAVIAIPMWIAMFVVVFAAAPTEPRLTDNGNVQLQGSSPAVALGFFGFMMLVTVISWVFMARMLIQRGHLGYDFADAAVGQKLVKDGPLTPLGSGLTAFIRSLAHILDAIPCYIGFLAPLFTAKRQTFADMAMGTVVIEAPPAHSVSALIVNALQIWKPVIKS